MVNINIQEKIDGDELDLSMMSLKEVPLREIASCPRAVKIDLSSNQLKTLPPTFGAHLSHIIKLDLSANKITALPKSFHLLVNLKHLDLYSNQLTDLPESLHHLKALRFLDIKNNPLKPELQKIVGDCITRKECEVAAKRLVLHFTKEKQAAIEQEIMANKAREAREQQQKEEAEAVRRINEKKAAKKERKNENKMIKQQDSQQQQQKQSASAHTSSKTANGTGAKNQKKPSKSSRSGGWCSCLGWINALLFLALASAASYCVFLHMEGDYSQAGLQKAVPRLQKSFHKLRNVTVEALQPANLRSTGQLVYKNANATAFQAAESVQKAAYATQEYLEVYTGDLTPYTSKVSEYCGIAYQWTKVRVLVGYEWLVSQDWQGMYDACVKFLAAVWNKIQDLWSEALKNPTVKSAWEAVCGYCSAAFTWLQQLLFAVIQYLQKNGPVWLEVVRDNTYNAVASVKGSVQSLLK